MAPSPVDETLSDAELLRLSLNGDQRSYSLLYDRYAPRIFAFCFRLLGERTNADDAMQTVFARAFRALPTLSNTSVFRSWLFSIARNEVFNVLRDKRRNGRFAPLRDDDVWLEDPTHETFVRREMQELLEQTLGCLKPEYREVIVLREFEQMSYAEISEITGNTVPSVESRLFKARKALIRRMKPYVDEWRDA